MRAVVVGAGRLGKAVREALSRRDIDVTVMSRSSGFDVLAPTVPTTIGEADAVVEATDIFTQHTKRARDFFVRSTRAVNAAARQAGAQHILVSILNCEQQALRRSGYYAGKAEQERIARDEHSDLTIVRSTLWFEFARQNLDRMQFGPIAIVPAMRVQPVALGTVAEVIAEVAAGHRGGALHEVAGPEQTTLWKMSRALPRRRALLLPAPAPGAAGRALRDGTLLPGPEVEIAGPRFTDWLAAGQR